MAEIRFNARGEQFELGQVAWTRQLYGALASGSYIRQKYGQSPVIEKTPYQVKIRHASQDWTCPTCGQKIDEGDMHGSTFYDHYCLDCITRSKPETEVESPKAPVTPEVTGNEQLLEMSRTDYYKLKNGQVIEAPSYPTSAKVLSLAELRQLSPDTIITAKYYSARRGGVARHKLTVGQIILPKAEAPATPEVTAKFIRIEGRAGGYQAWVMSDQGVEVGIGDLRHTFAATQAEARKSLADKAFVERFEAAWANKGYTFKKASAISEVAIPKAEVDLYWHSISELKQMCQQKGLSTEGSKEDLIRRLRRP